MMNRQNNGNRRGIEWTDYTWTPIGGCHHACRWQMPDGTVARCYAEDVAEGVARNAYPGGFDVHYWHPERLREPLKLKDPARIFMDSMSDLMGAWVPEAEISQILGVCRYADWHTFQLLTKNAPRLKAFDFPPNVWVGVSSSPDQMLGHILTDHQKERYMHKALASLAAVDAPIRWMSFEPLSWDVSRIVAEYPGVLQWAVIGAASNGNRKYQPDPAHVSALLDVLDRQSVPIFFKGNLDWSPWREEYPGELVQLPQAEQASLF